MTNAALASRLRALIATIESEGVPSSDGTELYLDGLDGRIIIDELGRIADALDCD